MATPLTAAARGAARGVQAGKARYPAFRLECATNAGPSKNNPYRAIMPQNRRTILSGHYSLQWLWSPFTRKLADGP